MIKLLPEKVEGKIFCLILISCIGTSLLATRLVVVSQEKALKADTRDRLARTARHQVWQMRTEFDDLERQAIEANRQITRALFEDTSFTLHSEIIEERPADVFITHSTGLTPGLRRQIASTTEPMKYVAPLMKKDFLNFYVALEDRFVRIGANDWNSLNQGPNDLSLPERIELAGPANNPEREPMWAPVHYHPAWERWLTNLLVPIYNGDRFVGITGSDYILDSVFHHVNQLSGAEDFGSAYVFNKAGDIVVHPPGASPFPQELEAPSAVAARAELTDEGVVNLIERYLRLSPDTGKSLHLAFENGGLTHMAYIVPMGLMGWNLAVVVSDDVIYKPAVALRWKLALSTIGVALILVALLRTSFRLLFTRRILRLEKATRDFAQRGIVDFPEPGHDEIGSLVLAFKEMVDSLASREAELTIRNQQMKNEISGRLSAVESLRESERKFRTLFEKSSDAVLVFDGERFIDCNEAAVKMFDCQSKLDLLATHPIEFSPERQPDGTCSREKLEARLDLARQNGKHQYEWLSKTAAGKHFWVEALITVIPYGGRDVFYMVWRDITTRKEEEEERIRLTTAIEQAAEVIIVTDPLGTVLYVNPSFERLTGYTRSEAVGRTSEVLNSEGKDGELLAEMWRTIQRGEVWKGRLGSPRKDGTLYQAETTISAVRDASGDIHNYVIVSYDVTKEASLEAQLLQAQKMEAIGELAAGIAHEINTPTQYIGDNIRFFQESFADILALLDKYRDLLEDVKDDRPTEEIAQEVDRIIQDIDLEFLTEEIPIAIHQSLEGNTRVAEIVRAMKEFAHPGLEDRTAIDINHAIENTIAVARNEWKYVAEVQTDFDADLPEVPCLPGAFNQVILNILVNAAHAIADAVQGGAEEKGIITITTRRIDGWAEVRIQDTGTGIPENLRTKIFDPFFTTKRAGKGTGQGLALVHTVIVEKHHGSVEIESEVGQGTTFIIRVPLAEQEQPIEDPEAVGADASG